MKYVSTKAVSGLSRTFLLLALLTLAADTVFGQGTSANVFQLDGKEYRRFDDKWFTYWSNRKGDQILPHRIVVKPINSLDLNTFDFESIGISDVFVEPRQLPGGYYVVVVKNPQRAFGIATSLLARGLFDHISFDALGELTGVPNDPRYTSGEQWNLEDKLNMEYAWDITRGSPSVVLAVIDSGIDYNHEDLVGNLWQNPEEDYDGVDDDGNGYIDDVVGWNFQACDQETEDCSVVGNNNPNTGSEHGTQVAGIAAAKTYNSKGIAGIAGGWDGQQGVLMMPVAVLTRFDEQTSSYRPAATSMAHAIEYAVLEGARVINLSQSFNENHQFIEDAVDFALQNNCVFVASAGNSGTSLYYPAAYSSFGNNGLISVGAVLQNDNRWSSSNHGEAEMKLDVMAPGGPDIILTTDNGNQYGLFGGTSAAAPHVAGVAALIRSINSSLSAATVESILKTTADSNGCIPVDPGVSDSAECGSGRVDAYAALKYTVETYGGTFTQDVTVPSGDTWNISMRLQLRCSRRCSRRTRLAPHKMLTGSFCLAIPQQSLSTSTFDRSTSGKLASVSLSPR